jgi:hypothetical protein
MRTEKRERGYEKRRGKERKEDKQKKCKEKKMKPLIIVLINRVSASAHRKQSEVTNPVSMSVEPMANLITLLMIFHSPSGELL